MATTSKVLLKRAGGWATAIVLPAWAAFSLQFVSDRHIVLGLLAWVGALVLMPGILLTAIPMPFIIESGNVRLILFYVETQFVLVAPILNWLVYFAVLVLIFRRRRTLAERETVEK